MKLYEGTIGERYLIRQILTEERLSKRLAALGLNEDTKVTVLHKKKSGTMIIFVRGTRLALGRRIAGEIEIEEEAAIHETD